MPNGTTGRRLGIVILTLCAVAISCGPKGAQDPKQTPATSRPPSKGTAPTSTRPGEQGSVAADFALTTSDGETVKLSDYKGKVVVLDFWATWCPPCRDEIPGFIQLKKEYESKGVEVIGVVVSDQWDKVDAFAESYGINYPIVMGDPTVIQRYGNFQGIPTTFIIDQDGIIRVKKTGKAPREFFVRSVEELL